MTEYIHESTDLQRISHLTAVESEHIGSTILCSRMMNADKSLPGMFNNPLEVGRTKSQSGREQVSCA